MHMTCHVSAFTLTHLWHFGRRPAHHFLLPHFLLDEDTGHVERAQQHVGLEPQSVALGWQQLQGVQCRIQVEAATQLDQQVHQRLTEIVRKREKGGREKVKGREGWMEGVWKKEPQEEKGREGETEGGRR